MHAGISNADHCARWYVHEHAYNTYTWTDGPDEDVTIWHTSISITTGKANAPPEVARPMKDGQPKGDV